MARATAPGPSCSNPPRLCGSRLRSPRPRLARAAAGLRAGAWDGALPAHGPPPQRSPADALARTLDYCVRTKLTIPSSDPLSNTLPAAPQRQNPTSHSISPVLIVSSSGLSEECIATYSVRLPDPELCLWARGSCPTLHSGFCAGNTIFALFAMPAPANFDKQIPSVLYAADERSQHADSMGSIG